MHTVFVLIVTTYLSVQAAGDWLLPIGVKNRTSADNVLLTSIGIFGLKRAARPTVDAHLHTGVDLCRPHSGFNEEPVYPASGGTVVSVRADGPFAQIIIEHTQERVWTVYEHVAGIRVHYGDSVTPDMIIARFMNKQELYQYGMHFNHLHFEIIRHAPRKLPPTTLLPERHCGTYALTCKDEIELLRCYYNPLDYLIRANRIPLDKPEEK